MSDKYNHKWVRILCWFKYKTYAVTISKNTTLYSCSKERAHRYPRWIKHENRHKLQWKRDGIFKFTIKYLWYQIRYGYEHNPYEVDARIAEDA